MSLTVLFDLDDTLLNTHLDHFLPAYFDALGQKMAGLAPKQVIIQQIHFAVRQMIANKDPGKQLSRVFSENFYSPLGTSKEEWIETVESFYLKDYPSLKSITGQKPEARSLIEWCKSQDFKIVIATNPLFPELATRQRIEWAGLDPQDFSFYTNYDNFHFTKPNLPYYAEILGRLGWPDRLVIMVGDNLSDDLIPIEKMGFNSFWIDHKHQIPSRPGGSLKDLKKHLEKLSKDEAVLSLSHDQAVSLAILRSTPAVISGLINEYKGDHLLNQTHTFCTVDRNLTQEHVRKERMVYQTFWQELLDELREIAQPTSLERIDKENSKGSVTEGNHKDHPFLENRKHSLKIIALIQENLTNQQGNIPSHYQDTFAETIIKLAEDDINYLRTCSKTRQF